MATPLFEPDADDVLVLVDLSAQLFRAYHAMTPLSSPSGEPTHAVYGTVAILERLMTRVRPRRFAIALDAGRQTFRSEIYPAYKANRPEPPEDLLIQLRRASEVVRAFTPHVWQKPGWEADDLIATAVTQARAQGLRVLVISGDKDLMQLVGPDVRLWDTMRDRVFGPPEVEEKFGVRVDQLHDFLALTGDSSDNIPGVPSVGPKTAAELLRRFETLEGVLTHTAEIERKKLRETLEEHAERARLSYRLVALAHDCDDVVDVAGAHFTGRDLPKLRELYRELGFGRMLAALGEDPSSAELTTPQASTNPGITTSATRALATPRPGSATTFSSLPEPVFMEALPQLEAWLAQHIGQPLALRLLRESQQQPRAPWVALALAANESDSVIVALAPTTLDGPKAIPLAPVLKCLATDFATRPKLWCHGAKQLALGWLQVGIEPWPLRLDSELASYLLDPEASHELDALAARLLGSPLEAPPAKGRKAPVPSARERMSRLGREALRIWQLCPVLEERLAAERLSSLHDDVELPLALLLARMQRDGVALQPQVLSELSVQLRSEIARLEAEAEALIGHPVNLNAPRQLETLLYDELGLKPAKRTKTARSTDAASLETLLEHHALPRLVLDHRQLVKLQNTYVETLPKLLDPETHRLHGSWDQVVAATGRISSTEPNLQNIPIRSELGRSIRRAFVAPPGCVLVSADYSQIELRVLAHLSQDATLLDAFHHNDDVHRRTAMAVFNVPAEQVTSDMRRRAKAVNFGVIYGQGEAGLAASLAIPRDEASQFIAAYFQRHTGVGAFMNQTLTDARATESVHSLLGRRRLLSDIGSSNRALRLAAERIAMNMPIQGTAADLLKLAMLAFREPPTPSTRLVLTVHDELVFEVAEGEVEQAIPIIRERMQSVFSLDVPLIVDVGQGPNWAEAH